MSLTCISCRASFGNPEAHRSHYKTEWHKYNLKRKAAELPSITFEEFQERTLAYSKLEETSAAEITYTCKPCHKNFSSKNSLVSHLNSKKHFDVIGKKPTEMELRVSIKGHSLNSESKLPPIAEPTNKVNISIIDSPHPIIENAQNSDDIASDDDDDDDWESIDDEEEMFEVPSNICLFCSCESENLEANVQHMKVLHSFYVPDPEYVINLDGLISYLGQKISYGFTCICCDLQKKSLKSVQQHMMDKGHCRMLFEEDTIVEYEDFYDYTASYPEGSQTTGDVNTNVLESDGYQLVLPSGSTIGHRSLAVYYRQNLPPVRAVASKVAKIMRGYRALCESGNSGRGMYYKASSCKGASQRQRKYSLKLGLKQNKFQPHFRSQIMF